MKYTILLVLLLVGCAEEKGIDSQSPPASNMQQAVTASQRPENIALSPAVVPPPPYKVTVMKKVDQIAKVMDPEKINAIRQQDEKNLADFHKGVSHKVKSLAEDLSNPENREALKQTLKNSKAYRESMLRLAKEQMR